METIKIKYFDNEIDKVEKISKGDLIDLRSAETVHLKKERRVSFDSVGSRNEVT